MLTEYGKRMFQENREAMLQDSTQHGMYTRFLREGKLKAGEPFAITVSDKALLKAVKIFISHPGEVAGLGYIDSGELTHLAKAMDGDWTSVGGIKSAELYAQHMGEFYQKYQVAPNLQFHTHPGLRAFTSGTDMDAYTYLIDTFQGDLFFLIYDGLDWLVERWRYVDGKIEISGGEIRTKEGLLLGKARTRDFNLPDIKSVKQVKVGDMVKILSYVDETKTTTEEVIVEVTKIVTDWKAKGNPRTITFTKDKTEWEGSDAHIVEIVLLGEGHLPSGGYRTDWDKEWQDWLAGEWTPSIHGEETYSQTKDSWQSRVYGGKRSRLEEKEEIWNGDTLKTERGDSDEWW